MNTPTAGADGGAAADAMASLPQGNPRAGGTDESTLPSREGLSSRKPVRIRAATAMQGVPAEYAWLKRRFGVLGEDWSVDVRSLGRDESGRTIETFRLRLKGGARVDVHFDISDFHQL